MNRMRVLSSSVIDASPFRVYGIFADYQHAHPQILPAKYFSKLELVHGGNGAGTRFKVSTRFMGQERMYEMEVTEPEPGRVLAERDTLTGLVTTFTVDPGPTPNQSNVTIATEWESQGRVAGFLERFIHPSGYAENLSCRVTAVG
ncbi:MAG: SRPBCC family protein [Bacteroidota bacterium]